VPSGRPRIYRSQRTGRERLTAEERKSVPLRKDAEESVVPLNSVEEIAVREVAMKKLEIELDPKSLLPLSEVVRRYIDAVLELKDGNKAKTALALGVGRTTIYRKLGLREK